MAEKLNAKKLAPNEDAAGVPRISAFTEIGNSGLKVKNGKIVEELETVWRMPTRIKTVEEMKRNATISAGLTFFRMMIAKAKWKVVPPVGATAEQKEKAKFIQTCMDDMDTSWTQFISSILTYLDYGFAINEKVYKRRVKGKSKYKDGLIGWKVLPSRAQSTVKGWVYNEDGRELTGFIQSLDNIVYKERFEKLLNANRELEVDREKFMLFTTGNTVNPEGNPLLKACYVAWRYLKNIEEQEQIGVSRDLGGLLHLGLPAAYFDPNASNDKKAVYEEFKTVARNVASGEQAAIMLPTNKDPETKGDLFTVELLTSQGSRGYDTNEIVTRYTSQILIALFADLLQLGNNATGSFALADGKKSLVESAIECRLQEIADVLNYDLIPQTFRMNQWDDTDYPKFVFEGVTEFSLDELGKFVQRVAAVKSIERDREFMNLTRSVIGLTPFPDDEPVHDDELGEAETGAGQGMEKGSGNGTSDNVSEDDNSSTNVENAS